MLESLTSLFLKVPFQVNFIKNDLFICHDTVDQISSVGNHYIFDLASNLILFYVVRVTYVEQRLGQIADVDLKIGYTNCIEWPSKSTCCRRVDCYGVSIIVFVGLCYLQLARLSHASYSENIRVASFELGNLQDFCIRSIIVL